jgi:hypothetical protein
MQQHIKVIMKTKQSTPACQGCMLLPICRHKSFVQLMGDCSLINDDIRAIERILQPTKWGFKTKGTGILWSEIEGHNL